MAEIKNNYKDEKKTEATKNKPKVGAKLKEKTTKEKIRDAFIADEVHDVKSYILFDVIIPAIKQTFRSLVVNTVDMALFGKVRNNDRQTEQRGGSTYIAYERAYKDRRDRDRDDFDRDRRRGSGNSISIDKLDRVIFPTKDDAIEVLGYLMDNIEEYGVTSVADFLSASDIDVNPIHHKWGWMSLEGSNIYECSDGSGYIIRMPRPKSI